MGVVIRQSLKATIVSYVGACIGAWVVIYLYPKCLSTEQIGLTKVLTEAALFFSVFAQMGMGSISIKFFPFFKDTNNNHNGFPFIICVVPLIGFIIFVLVFLLFQHSIKSLFDIHSKLFSSYLFFVIPLTLFWMYITIFETYASLLQRIVFPRIIKEIVVRILTIVIILLLYFNILTLSQFVVCFVVIYGVAMLLNVWYINSIQKIDLKPNFNFIKQPLKKDMLVFATYMIAVGIGSSIFAKIDIFMLSQKISLSSTGVFTIAYFIASFIEMPSRAIFQITTPFVSESLKNNDVASLDSLYKRVSNNQLFIGGMLFLLIWINADNIFAIMPNGHIFEEGKYVIFFIGLAKVFDAATGINGSILGYSKYYYYSMYFIFALAILAVVNNWYLIPRYGITGAAIATATTVFLYNTLLVLFVKWKLKTQPFSKNTIKIVSVLTLLIILNTFIPALGNVYADVVLRSGLHAGLFLFFILYFRMAPDVNDLVVSVKNKYLNPYLTKKQSDKTS